MRIEVKTGDVSVKSGTARSTGRPYTIREQLAWIDTGKAYPAEIRIRLGDQQEAFPPGVYVVTPACFWVDKYGSLQVDLAKMQKAAPQPAAGGARVAG